MIKIFMQEIDSVEKEKKEYSRISKWREFTIHMFRNMLRANGSSIWLCKWVLEVFYCSGIKWTVSKVQWVD